MAKLDIVAVPPEFANIAVSQRPPFTFAGRAAVCCTKPLAATERRHHVFQPGRSRRRRLHARKDRAAAGNQSSATTSTKRSACPARAMTRAQSQVPPLTSGYEPELRERNGQFDRARARALLMYMDTSIATAMAGARCRMDRRSSSRWQQSRASLTVRSTKCGSGNWTRLPSA